MERVGWMTLVVATVSSGVARADWEARLTATQELNPGAPDSGLATFATGMTARLSFALGEDWRLGMQADGFLQFPLAATFSSDARELDVTAIARARVYHEGAVSAFIDLGLGFAVLQSENHSPGTSCHDCTHHDSGLAFDLGFVVAVALGGSFAFEIGTRGHLHAAPHFDGPEMEPLGSPTLRIDLGISYGF